MTMKKPLLMAALLALALNTPALAAEPGKALLNKLKSSLSSIADFSADFTQTTTLEAAALDRAAHGKLTMKRGSKVRWEYLGEDPQTIICDGKTVWVHQVRDRTVIRRKFSELTPAAKAALDLLSGIDQVERYFAVSSCGPTCVSLKPLTPDPDLALVNIETVPAGNTIKAVVTEDPVGNRTRIELTNFKTDNAVSDSLFDFVVPEGVDVFDGQGKQQ